MKRFASIDLGSNTVRLLIMEADDQGNFRELASDRVICRLGEGIHTQKRLQEDRIALTLKTLLAFKRKCAEYGDIPIQVVATSAVREAENREEFLTRAREETGLKIEVISWKEEARLTLEGVFWKPPPVGRRILTFDIGGGSTEYILSEGKHILGTVGTSLGVVRLTERFIHRHPVDPVEEAALDEFLQTELQQVRGRLNGERLDTLIGTAGTVTTLAALDQNIYPYDPERIHGMVLPRRRIEALFTTLKSQTLEERLAHPALERGREDLIIAGTALVLATLKAFDCDNLTVSEYSLREGILLKAFRAGTPSFD